jgi:hypothetical protein
LAAHADHIYVTHELYSNFIGSLMEDFMTITAFGYDDSPFYPGRTLRPASRTAKPRQERLYKQITRRVADRENSRSRLV